MRGTRALGVVVIGAALAALAGCSGGAHPGATGPTTAPTTASSASTSSASASSGPPTTNGSGAVNLVVTDQLRSALVAAGAALDQLPASDYTGLRPGETYYAYDASTQTYWAGAGLAPSSSSTPAQVASQDDGAYTLFRHTGSAPWTAYAVGVAGTEGSTCPTSVPAAVLALWGWAPGSCRPPTIE